MGLISSAGFSQQSNFTLTFLGVDSATNVQLDSIKVMNRSQDCERIIYWPNKTLTLQGNTAISDLTNHGTGFQVFQNYPNPAVYQTTVSINVPQDDNVGIIITDMSGNLVNQEIRRLCKGVHSFTLTSGGENLYIFTAYWRGYSRSIKILQTGSYINGTSSLEYIENQKSTQQFKTTNDINAFLFNLGDTLLFIGHSNGIQTGILDAPDTSRNYKFQFAHNIPCIGTPTIEYEGKVYQTIQIFSQCWLKENLDVGTMISGSEEMTDNGIIEKYCFGNEPDSCTKYGGLYQWDEMMKYSTNQGAQGICPPNWHIPTDEEWKVLEGTVDYLYGIGDSEWDQLAELRGYNAGTNLKTYNGWYNGGNGSDLFGFSGLPGGEKIQVFFGQVLLNGNWWSSTDDTFSDEAFSRRLTHSDPVVFRLFKYNFKNKAYSVRCIMND